MALSKVLCILIISYFLGSLCSKESVYSSYFCVGQPWYYNANPATGVRCRQHCMFKDVYFNWTSKSFLYYRKRNFAKLPMFIDGNAKEHFDFPMKFGGILRPDDKLYPMQVVFVDFLHKRLKNAQPNISYILTPKTNHFHTNFGHTLWQYLIPIYNLRLIFQLNDEKILTIYKENPSDFWVSHDYLNIVSQKAPISIEELNAHTNSNNVVHFPRIVLGDIGCLDRMAGSHNRPVLHGLSHNLRPHLTPKQPRICLMQKAAHRVPTNYPEIIQTLKHKFPNIDLILLSPGNTLTNNQINILKDVTLLISPAGGIACSAPLLPQGSTILEFGFYNTNLNITYDYDSSLWAEFTHISTIIFPILPKEITECPEYDENDLQYRDWGSYVYCSYNVNLLRLESMVREILYNWKIYNM